MPQLDPTWFISQLFWLALTFGFLFVMLKRFVLPNLMGTLELRQQSVESDVQRAKTSMLEAEGAKHAYERALNDARMRTEQLLADAAATDKQRAETRLKEVDIQIAQRLGQAGVAINNKKNELLEALTPTVSELAEAMVEKLIRKQPKREHIEAVAQEALRVRVNQKR